ncbi:MAG: hypothetical protein HKN07_09445 [Acidimicrobiia bacterium]|nr:hypothetical protein [Acidimicrobiia bacterium]
MSTTSLPVPETVPTEAPATTSAVQPVVPDLDRLVVLGQDGNVYTMGRDGGERVDLTTDAGTDARYFQPIWSPTGELIAVSESRADGTVSMSTIDLDTGEFLRSESAAPPFYYSWAPDGERLVYLSGAGQLTLTLIEPGAEGTVIGAGQPFYFAWHSTAEQMLVHIGTSRLELLDITGEITPIDALPGAFQAPSWQNGVQLYVRDVGDRQEMVLDEGGDQTVVTTYTTASFFTLSPDGKSVAYRVSGDSDEGVISAAFRQATDQLQVFDAATGTSVAVSDKLVVAFWWSPDSKKLLYLDLLDSGGLQWHVWDGIESTDHATFLPSPTFARDFLPFFDQYALSMTLWSPDSNAYAFPGVIDSEVGIWVQELGETEPSLVGDGVFVGWSPR